MLRARGARLSPDRETFAKIQAREMKRERFPRMFDLTPALDDGREEHEPHLRRNNS